MNYTGLGTPILLALIGVLCLALSWKEEHLPAWVKLFLMLAAIILFLFAIFAVIDIINEREVNRSVRLYAAEARTESVLRLEALGRIDPTTLEWAMQNAPNILMILNNDGIAEYLWRWQTQEVPFWSIEEFFAKSNDTYLCPIGSYPEGRKREYARIITDFLVQMGKADPSEGRYSAKWKDTESYHWALRAFRIEDKFVIKPQQQTI